MRYSKVAIIFIVLMLSISADAATQEIAEGYKYLEETYPGWEDRVRSQTYADWIATQHDDVKRWAASDNVKDAESLIQAYDNYLLATGKMVEFDTPDQTEENTSVDFYNPWDELESSSQDDTGFIDPWADREATTANKVGMWESPTIMTATQSLILIISFGIAYYMCRLWVAWWIKPTAFFLSLIVAWVGGTVIVSMLFVTDHYTDAIITLLAIGFWFALVGSGVGVFYGQRKS